MKKSIFKIAVILIFVGLNWNGLLAVGETLAYFFDNENSNDNAYKASTLYFSLRSDQSDFVPTGGMIPGSLATRDIYIKKEGTLPFKYQAHSEPVDEACDLDLYNNLELKVWYKYYNATPTDPLMVLKYEGLLKDFDDFDTNPDDPDLRIPNDHPYIDNLFYGLDEHWFYSEVTLPLTITEDLQNMSCQFKFVFDGWQPEFSDPSFGYSDNEEILNSVSTGNWMPEITVIYPNGGETWYLVPDTCPGIPWCSQWCQDHGMNADCEYPIQWTATNLIGPDLDLLIDLHFSADSSSTWLSQFADDTENDGTFWWKLPYDPSYITDQARIKAVATHQDYSFLTNWDISDADFCPPMLSLEDMMHLESPALPELPELPESPVVEEDPGLIPEEPPEEESPEPETVLEEEPEEEIINPEEDVPEDPIEPEDITEEGPQEEILPEEAPEEEITIEDIEEDIPVENTLTTEEIILNDESAPAEEEDPGDTDEEPTQDEEPAQQEEQEIPKEEPVEEEVIEEAPVEDTSVEETTPAIEEEPVVIPEDNPSPAENPEDSGDSGDSGEDAGE